jgi:hypothetical protein
MTMSTEPAVGVPTDEDVLVAVEEALEGVLLPDPGFRLLEAARNAVLDAVGPLVARLRQAPAVPVPPPTDQAAVGLASVRPQTLANLATHLDARAVAILRPESEVYAEWQTVVAWLRRLAAEAPTTTRETLVELVRDFLDPDPCSFDHHGYCQAHSWLCGGTPCPHGRAREVLAAIDSEPAAGVGQDGAQP